MKSPAAAPWRRLAPLALVVTLAHLAFLGWGAQASVRPTPPQTASFATRTITPPAPPQPATASPSVAIAAAAAAATPTAPAPAPPPPPAAPVAKPPPVSVPKAPTAPAPAAALAPAPDTARDPAPVAQPRPAPVPQPTASAAVAAAPATSAAPSVPAAPAPAPAEPTTAVAVLPSGRLNYEVIASWKGIPVRGSGTLDWRHDGSQYEARMEIASLGRSRVQRSTGRITAQGLAPGYFSDKSRSEQAAHFDRDRGRVVFSTNNPPAPLEPGLQDRLSVVLQLAALVAGAPERFPAGTEIGIPTASTRETEDWVFEVEGEDNLQLPGGTVRALKLQRQPRKQYDQKVELWLAPRMDYAPVRVRLTNPNGDTVDQRWSSTDKG